MTHLISDLYAAFYSYNVPPTKLTLNPSWMEPFKKLDPSVRADQLEEWKKFMGCDVEFSESEPDFRFS
jgi:hypothetical protein